MTAPITSLAPALTSALQSAAGRAGVSFDFMVRTAVRESGLDSSAKATTSSAAGLFQFVEQTWLNMVSRHGAANGLANEAEAVVAKPNGRLTVENQDEYQRILNLRFNPTVSAQMAGELTRENSQVLQRHLGRKPEEAELYIAHFMGAGQAAALINAANVTPGAQAAILFPKEARANRPIFYTQSGDARSVGDVLVALKSAHAPKDTGLAEIVANPVPVTPTALDASSAPRASHAPFYRAFGAPVLHLTPAIMQILSELTAPQSSAEKEQDRDQSRKRMPPGAI